MSKLIIGCGYLGERVAKLWLNRGERLFAVTRSDERAEAFSAMGIEPIVADITEPKTLDGLAVPNVGTVLFAVGYDRKSGKSIDEVYVDGLRNVLAKLSPDIHRLIYISSTGVYGQSTGEWVDESSPCNPTRPGGKACLAAETMIAKHPLGSRAIILRLAGIYGPDRVPRKKDLLAGKLVASTSGHLNLIHVDDAADVVLAAESSSGVPATYVVSDEFPVPRRQYYEEICRLLGLTDVEYVDPPVDSPAGQRALADKRIRSDRLRESLDIALKYPTFREGLAEILRSK